MSTRWQAGWVLGQVRLFLLLNRPLAALQRLDAFLLGQPDEPQALATRAHVLAGLGQVQEARLSLARLVQLRTSDAPTWFNYGFLCEACGDLEEALDAFQQAVALDPWLDRAWYGLGLALIRLRRLDEAVHALRRNTELQPMSPYGWYQLARVELERQQPAETLRIIQHLKGFEPKVAAQLERETGLRAKPR